MMHPIRAAILPAHAEQFCAVNAAMRPLPTPSLWATRWTGTAIFAAFALVPFFILTVESFL